MRKVTGRWRPGESGEHLSDSGAGDKIVQGPASGGCANPEIHSNRRQNVNYYREFEDFLQSIQMTLKVNRSRIREVGESEIPKHFRPVLDMLEGCDGFFCGVDIAQADGIEFKEGGEKGDEKDQSDGDFGKG